MWLSGLYGTGKGKIGIKEFRAVFLDLYPSLCIYASRFVHDVEISKDIVQEVFLTFWEENHILRNKDLIKPYLFKSVKNKALNYKKRESRKSGLDELFDTYLEKLTISENESVEAYLSYSRLQSDLNDAIQELPAQRQLIFRMSRFQEMRHKQIAKELKISPKTVETQIYRTLKFLREKLKHHLE